MAENPAFERDMLGQPIIVCDIVVYSVTAGQRSELRIGMVTGLSDKSLKVIVFDDDQRWNRVTEEFVKERRFFNRSVQDMSKVFKVETFSNQYNELRAIFEGYEEFKQKQKAEKAAASKRSKAKKDAANEELSWKDVTAFSGEVNITARRSI